MARGAAQARRKRTKADARRRRRRAQTSAPATVVERSLFFVRLRRQAKWVFVFLALVFAIGFVVFGVGSGGGIGLGDLFNSGSSSKSAASESDARKKIKENPNNAAAYRELATALETKGEVKGAIAALRHYTKLRPKDTEALGDLAGLYTSQGTKLSRQASAAQVDAASSTAGALFGPLMIGKVQFVPQDEITSAVSQAAQTRSTELLTAQQDAFKSAENVFQRIARITPKDATAQLNLGQAAQQAGDTAIAITAYRRFVKLAPADPTTPTVKKLIKQLRKSSQPPVTVGG